MIYGYIRTSRAAVDGLAGMHPETQVQAQGEAGVEPDNIVSDVGISGSVPRHWPRTRPPPSGCCAATGSPSPRWRGPSASPARPTGAPSGRRVWGSKKPDDLGALRAHLRRLRRKLGEDVSNPTYFSAEPRVGYRMPRGEGQEELRP